LELDFITAAESHYKAKMDEAALTMRVYMRNAAGVGEHPQVFEEFRNVLEDFQNARENFKLVQELKSQFISAQQAESAPEGTEGED
tara:strand:- start:2276 stop:2533 length:258 start_codon:yes stop_codon:yes gene_type:complete